MGEEENPQTETRLAEPPGADPASDHETPGGNPVNESPDPAPAPAGQVDAAPLDNNSGEASGSGE